ncbi:MAG: hypothetical protein AAF085_14620 [Planctomycetota bacterium]
MNCPKCKARLKYVYSVKAGENARTIRYECPKCFIGCTAVSTIISSDEKYGQGPTSIANGIKEGTVKIDVVVKPSPSSRSPR